MLVPITDQPFFVVGSDRSGSTMLRLMLNEHSRLCIPPETWFITDLMDRFPPEGRMGEEQVEEGLDVVRRHWRWKEWMVSFAELDSLRLLREPTLAKLVNAVFRLKCASKPRWGDKTPGYLTEISRLHRVFPEAKFLHIVRDGRDVCVSLRRTGWRGDTTWSIARYWGEHVGAGFRQGRSLPPSLYMEVRYDDLVLKTEETLRAICSFLGETFEPAMLRFYERAEQETPERARKVHTKTLRAPRESDLGRWKRELGRLQVLIFEAGAGETMARAGQALRFPLEARLARPLFNLLAQAAVVTLPLRNRVGLHLPRLRARF